MDACWHVTVLERQHQSAAVSSFRRYLGTPEAMRLMRSPGGGVPPSRFRPPVYVTIWSLDQRRLQKRPALSKHLFPSCGLVRASGLCDALTGDGACPDQEHAACELNPTGTAAEIRGSMS
jgi:hypothetical protein